MTKKLHSRIALVFEMTQHIFKIQDTNPENKLRLLMIYATVYPEKFEGDKGVKLMQVAFGVIENPL